MWAGRKPKCKMICPFYSISTPGEVWRYDRSLLVLFESKDQIFGQEGGAGEVIQDTPQQLVNHKVDTH